MRGSRADIVLRVFLAALLALSIQAWHTHALPEGGSGPEAIASNADLLDHSGGITGNPTCLLCLLAGSTTADAGGLDHTSSLIETQILQPAPSPSLLVVSGRIQADRGPPRA
jgi:hypothetical protein